MAGVTLPAFAAEDLLSRLPEGCRYRRAWPSLFVAPQGASSHLHIDALQTHFWMALAAGQKRWTFFHPDDTPLLYPDYRYSSEPTFAVRYTLSRLRYPNAVWPGRGGG
jgi:hypothetical protein